MLHTDVCSGDGSGRALRIGVINWDCALPEDTYFGRYAIRSLSDPVYKDRIPYYADMSGDGRIAFRRKTQEEFDRELSYAIGAGIDYFAYTWYTDEKIPADSVVGREQGNCVDDKLWELGWARQLHMKSALRNKIGLCAILVCMHAYFDSDFCKLAEAMKQPYYEKVDGRPLVCLFGGYRRDYIERLRRFPEEFGCADPYIVFFNHGKGALPGEDYSAADAVSSYGCGCENTKDFSDLIAREISNNEKRKDFGVPVLPQFTMGWNPMPRVDNPVPWTSYPRTDYPHPAESQDVRAEAEALAGWIDSNRDHIVPDRIHAFAWNEFEEGGYICPTKAPDGGICTSHLDSFADAVRFWRKTL
ncbi:MAG: hypothetical protein IJV00_03095 [Clostridia bacterium]|nr:hypothetical protein [Clostridia bacterium]